MTRRPVALVVGASRGLGFLIAEDLVRRGHDVVLSSRDVEQLERARARLESVDPDAALWCLPCDVSQRDQVDALVQGAETQTGGIDVCVIVAGVIQVGPFAATREEHFRQSMDVMAWGPIHIAQALVPRMVERGYGCVGVVSSVGGRVPAPRLLPYTAAKFAALGFAEGLAVELAGTGVTATAVIPGLMRTGSHEAATYFGDARRQYAWFASLASMPVITVNAESAAHTIVGGVLAGRRVVHVGWVAKVASLAHGVAPGLVIRGSQLVSRVLPRGEDPTIVSGSQVRRGLRSRLVDRLTVRADIAAQRSNEKPTRGR